MSKLLLCYEEPQQPNLPATIVLNPRKKIEADQIPIEDLDVQEKDEEHYEVQLVPYPVKPPPRPIPKFPLHISWHPNTLCFKLDEEPITHRVWIWNRSKRSIYFNCCGLWDDTARYGASWRCFPRTRIWLPPGLRAEMFVRATPRELSPIPTAITYMQIAAGHLRDNVTGYFSIPIHAQFFKYITPPIPEGSVPGAGILLNSFHDIPLHHTQNKFKYCGKSHSGATATGISVGHPLLSIRVGNESG